MGFYVRFIAAASNLIWVALSANDISECIWEIRRLRVENNKQILQRLERTHRRG